MYKTCCYNERGYTTHKLSGIIVSTNEGTICSVTYTEFNNIFESIHSNLSIISLIADSLYNEEENKRKFKRIEDKLNIILSRLGVN